MNAETDPRIVGYNAMLDRLVNEGLSESAAKRKIAVEHPEVNAEHNVARTELAGRKPEVAETSATALHAALPKASAPEVLNYCTKGVPVAEAAWDWAVKAEIKRGRPEGDAKRAVARNQPEVHAAYLASYNARMRGHVPA